MTTTTDRFPLHALAFDELALEPLTLDAFALGALVLIPLLASAISVLLPARARGGLGVVVGLGIAAFTVPVVGTVSAGGVSELVLGGHQAPLGIHLRADGLSAVFLAVSALVGLVISGFAAVLPSSTGTQLGADEATPGRRVVQWQPQAPAFWPLWLGCWSGMNAVFVSGDLFNLYVGLELVGLTAVALVALGGPSSWAPALRYLFIAVLGSLLFLAGVGLLVAATGTLDLLQVSAALEDSGSQWAAVLWALCLISVGLGMKIALVPMHRWLVPAHSGAPGAVSPLLSALVIKAGLFILLRCWLWLGGPLLGETAQDDGARLSLDLLSWTLGALGAAAVLGGSVMALRQDRLKPLVAYSTVAQIGYWFLVFPLLSDSSGEDVSAGAFGGAVALALGHAIAKAGLFLAAGFLKDLYGTDEIGQLRGVSAHHPMLVLAMGLSAVGLIGLPISLGFTGKWQLATAAVAAQQWWILLVLAAGTLLSAGYLLRAVAPLLLESEAEDGPTQRHHRVSVAERTAEAAPFVLGLMTVATGFFAVWFDDLLGVGAPW